MRAGEGGGGGKKKKEGRQKIHIDKPLSEEVKRKLIRDYENY